jgi:hypothetical protein
MTFNLLHRLCMLGMTLIRTGYNCYKNPESLKMLRWKECVGTELLVLGFIWWKVLKILNIVGSNRWTGMENKPRGWKINVEEKISPTPTP